MDISKQEAKLEELEELINNDEANGRHYHHKLKEKLKECNLCPIELSRKIEEEIKTER